MNCWELCYFRNQSTCPALLSDLLALTRILFFPNTTSNSLCVFSFISPFPNAFTPHTINAGRFMAIVTLSDDKLLRNKFQTAGNIFNVCATCWYYFIDSLSDRWSNVEAISEIYQCFLWFRINFMWRGLCYVLQDQTSLQPVSPKGIGVSTRDAFSFPLSKTSNKHHTLGALLWHRRLFSTSS